MKTVNYNPSQLEIELANIIVSLKQEIGSKFQGQTITQIASDLTQDNPAVKITLVDKDGDNHDVVIKIVQLPDKS